MSLPPLPTVTTCLDLLLAPFMMLSGKTWFWQDEGVPGAEFASRRASGLNFLWKAKDSLEFMEAHR